MSLKLNRKLKVKSPILRVRTVKKKRYYGRFGDCRLRCRHTLCRRRTMFILFYSGPKGFDRRVRFNYKWHKVVDDSRFRFPPTKDGYGGVAFYMVISKIICVVITVVTVRSFLQTCKKVKKGVIRLGSFCGITFMRNTKVLILISHVVLMK